MEWITLEEITPTEWQQIRYEAISVLNSGIVGKDELKASIHGFFNWLLKNNYQVGVEMPGEGDTIQ